MLGNQYSQVNNGSALQQFAIITDTRISEQMKSKTNLKYLQFNLNELQNITKHCFLTMMLGKRSKRKIKFYNKLINQRD